jgi:molybdopterin biosynthesis enzyme
MALANCLVVIEEEVTTVEVGSPVTVIPLLLSNR